MISIDTLEAHISRFICNEMDLLPEDIDPDLNLGAFGLGSLASTRLIGSLEETFALRLSPTMVFEHPSISRLAEAIAQIAAEQHGGAAHV
ncbi:acyl carrier protein [Pseudochelatococcus contaminans]|uniref:Acyl carrier protein n=1 Tax=Pseudochelatococcus contaminans TaxID=1538103 RepID=A0A7W5Z6I9_9HYPH|nr:acyl carrier protein [Pseudochelatococcus contaminans]MBB3811106.1 acyl carrier protein [Pseudochelatococcus contaminans]